MSTSSLRRALSRGATLLAATAALTVVPVAAQAHVTVQPAQVEGGSFSVVAFRVPTERDDAATTRVSVLLPEAHPLGSVRTTPVPGWKISTETRKLDNPIDLFGSKVDTVVSQVTWSATGDGVAPGQYQDFSLSLGALPADGTLSFTALQTYDDGEQVRWNEVAAAGAEEPEHPAPTLTLTPAAGGTESTSDEHPVAAGDTTSAAASTDDGGSALPVALAAGALVAALLALGVALASWRRGRA